MRNRARELTFDALAQLAKVSLRRPWGKPGTNVVRSLDWKTLTLVDSKGAAAPGFILREPRLTWRQNEVSSALNAFSAATTCWTPVQPAGP